MFPGYLATLSENEKTLYSAGNYIFKLTIETLKQSINPPGMRRRSGVSFRSHIG